jgi:hypothetical protein
MHIYILWLLLCVPLPFTVAVVACRAVAEWRVALWLSGVSHFGCSGVLRCGCSGVLRCGCSGVSLLLSCRLPRLYWRVALSFTVDVVTIWLYSICNNFFSCHRPHILILAKVISLQTLQVPGILSVLYEIIRCMYARTHHSKQFNAFVACMPRAHSYHITAFVALPALILITSLYSRSQAVCSRPFPAVWSSVKVAWVWRPAKFNSNLIISFFCTTPAHKYSPWT